MMGIDGRQGLYPLILVSNSPDARMLIGIIQEGNALLGTAFTDTGNTGKACTLLSSLKDKQKLLAGKKGGLPILVDKEPIDWETPPAIVEYLDKYVIKQNDAKHILAVAFSDYMARMKAKEENMPVGHIVLTGPTGVGKTLSIETIAKKAGIPFVRTTCASKSVDGFTGEHFSKFLVEVREKAQGEAPYCIVLVDELDKTVWGGWGGADFGQRIQECLISYIDGVTVQGDMNNPAIRGLGLNTKNILFVFAGAFLNNGEMSLDDIVMERVCSNEPQIGFGKEPKKKELSARVMQNLSPEDIIKYGLKAELVGRIPWLAVLESLSVEDKTKILLESRQSPLKHSMRLLELKGYRTRIDDDVPRYIAECCPEETGARALYSICNNLFTSIRFEPNKYADNKMIIRVTLEMAKELITLYGKKG